VRRVVLVAISGAAAAAAMHRLGRRSQEPRAAREELGPDREATFVPTASVEPAPEKEPESGDDVSSDAPAAVVALVEPPSVPAETRYLANGAASLALEPEPPSEPASAPSPGAPEPPPGAMYGQPTRRGSGMTLAVLAALAGLAAIALVAWGAASGSANGASTAHAAPSLGRVQQGAPVLKPGVVTRP
jgi:hypothetical protein